MHIQDGPKTKHRYRYRSLCAFAINEDGAEKFSPPPFQKFWICHWPQSLGPLTWMLIFLSENFESTGGTVNHSIFDAWPVRRQASSYLPSFGATPPIHYSTQWRKSRGEQGDTSPKNVGWGTVMHHIPPTNIARFLCIVSDCGSFLNSAQCFGIIVTVQLQPVVESLGLFT